MVTEMQTAGAPSDAVPTPTHTLVFPDGMVGCPTWQHFILDEPAATAPVGMLRCLDEPEVAFYVVDPHEVLADYALELSDGERDALKLGDPSCLKSRCVLVIRKEPFALSANLLGPIVWNSENGFARQVVLANSGYSARHVLTTDPASFGGGR
jgi:flagellar assembly factor FliW